MSSRLDLTPADLDRLEDALEDLELSSASGELDADDPVAQRLSEYRELLRLGRDAMPLEDVPAGLLDGVIAEARKAAATAPAKPAGGPSFWARWRLGVWVPALAFAGSAALLLVVLVPKNEAPSAERVAASSEASKADAKRDEAPAADRQLAFAEPHQDALSKELAEGDAKRGSGVAIGERAPEPITALPGALPAEEIPEEELAEQGAAPADDAPAAAEAPLRRKAASGSSTGTASGGKPVPKAPASAGGGAGKKGSTPSPDPLGAEQKQKDKKADAGDDLWSEIQRADADRRGGSCGLAKMRYDKLRKVDDDARVRARALAGAGLCAAANDDMSTAKKLFDQARNADPDVSRFIDAELALLESGRSNARDPAPSQSAD